MSTLKDSKSKYDENNGKKNTLINDYSTYSEESDEDKKVNSLYQEEEFNELINRCDGNVDVTIQRRKSRPVDAVIVYEDK
tara:strand:+ start:435 stop:674 length:240 start_codon:yes stop_codon:yes gene_type:complete